MQTPGFTEGTATFSHPSLSSPASTWYRVYGKLPPPRGVTPLVGLHGGPGACHNYLTCLSDLTTTYSIPVILYDQIGNGNSTHFKEKANDPAFWSTSLFLAELDSLLDHLQIHDNFDLLGQSWGGMMAAEYAVSQPRGLRRIVVADAPADMSLWISTQKRLLTTLPQQVQDDVNRLENEGKTQSEEYEAACAVYYQRFLCRLDPWPQDVLESLNWLVKKDPTVFLTILGPSEFNVTGPLKDWNLTPELHKISVPTLLVNGRYDEAQDDVVWPFFRHIPKVKWITLSESSHMPMWEERPRFMEIAGEFLTNN